MRVISNWSPIVVDDRTTLGASMGRGDMDRDHLAQRYTGRVNSLVFSPDGSRLVGGLSDGTIKIWRGTEVPHGSP